MISKSSTHLCSLQLQTTYLSISLVFYCSTDFSLTSYGCLWKYFTLFIRWKLRWRFAKRDSLKNVFFIRGVSEVFVAQKHRKLSVSWAFAFFCLERIILFALIEWWLIFWFSTWSTYYSINCRWLISESAEKLVDETLERAFKYFIMKNFKHLL